MNEDGTRLHRYTSGGKREREAEGFKRMGSDGLDQSTFLHAAHSHIHIYTNRSRVDRLLVLSFVLTVRAYIHWAFNGSGKVAAG